MCALRSDAGNNAVKLYEISNIGAIFQQLKLNNRDITSMHIARFGGILMRRNGHFLKIEWS